MRTLSSFFPTGFGTSGSAGSAAGVPAGVISHVGVDVPDIFLAAPKRAEILRGE